MTRIGQVVLALSVAVALTVVTMNAGRTDQPVILEATVAGDTITVTGMNFGEVTPMVTLGTIVCGGTSTVVGGGGTISGGAEPDASGASVTIIGSEPNFFKSGWELTPFNPTSTTRDRMDASVSAICLDFNP